jgi:hypothetical protein
MPNKETGRAQLTSVWRGSARFFLEVWVKRDAHSVELMKSVRIEALPSLLIAVTLQEINKQLLHRNLKMNKL